MEKMEVEVDESEKENFLKNHLILEQIGKHLSTADLISARSACKYWYSIFSPKIAIHLNDKDDFSSLIKFHNKSSEDRNLGKLPYKKFNFLKNMDFPTFSWVAIKKHLGLTRGLNHGQIREISIPPIPLRSYWAFLEIMVPTLEYLELGQIISSLSYFTSETQSSSAKSAVSVTNPESGARGDIVPERFIFKKLWHIVLHSYCCPIEGEFHYFFPGIFKISASTLEKITISNKIFNEQLWIILDHLTNECQTLKNLQSLQIETKLSETNLIKLIELANKVNIQKIMLKGYVRSFNSRTLVDFFQTLALYSQDTMPKLYEKSISKKYFYQDNKISDWTKITLPLRIQEDFKFSLEKILHHFPELKAIKLNTMSASFAGINDLDKLYPKVEELNFLEFYHNHTNPNEDENQLVPIAENIVLHFPNLKVLSVCMDKYQNGFASAIFQNLTKLEELYIALIFKVSTSHYLESEITGICESDQNFCRDFNYDALKSLNIDNFDKNLKGISNLKELRKLTLFKDISAFTLLFGISFLPKLEFLSLPLIFLSEKSLKIFHNDFPSLKRLVLSEFTEMTPQMFFSVLGQRPKFEIELSNELPFLNSFNFNDYQMVFE